MNNRKRVSQFLIDDSLTRHPLIGELLACCRPIPVAWFSNSAEQLLRSIRGQSTRTVVITRNPGLFFKPMHASGGIPDPERIGHYRFDMLQGCPGRCLYCFCRCYLNTPSPHVFLNIEDATGEPACRVPSRLVTGDIADSLALGSLSLLLHEYAAICLPDSRFELRSKFALPPGWQRLDPRRFRLDWSISPARAIRSFEPGTDHLDTRLDSIGKAVQAGFPVGLRLDPLQNYASDDLSYVELICEIARRMRGWMPEAIVLGAYKLTPELRQLILKTSPLSGINTIEWTLCEDAKYRPSRALRIPLYRRMIDQIDACFPGVQIHLSMEPAWVWNLFPRCRVESD